MFKNLLNLKQREMIPIIRIMRPIKIAIPLQKTDKERTNNNNKHNIKRLIQSKTNPNTKIQKCME